jgi:3-oxo-5-alpha-steroid 4-dehydrogenase 1
MTGDPTYDAALTFGLTLSLVTALASLFVTTPYGRFARDDFGPTVPQRAGWLLMEAPALLVFPIVFAMGPQSGEAVPLFFAGLWELHYANRAVYFPMTLRVKPGARMGLVVPLSGWVVVPLHAWLFATWYGRLGANLDASWLWDPRFWLGTATYLFGLGLILHSERTLRRLRPDDASVSTYKIPYGGGFAWVSSPHYLGELIAWAGLTVATWCPGGLFIFTVSLANLVPRAAKTHRWYHEHFEGYPRERTALIPRVW